MSTTNKAYLELLRLAKEGDAVELQAGVVLETKEFSISQQNNWKNEENIKIFDFSTAPFWITTDTNAEPIAIHNEHDLEREDTEKQWPEMVK